MAVLRGYVVQTGHRIVAVPLQNPNFVVVYFEPS